QAVLFTAVGALIEAEGLGSDDWSLTDEELIERLRTHPATKDFLVHDFFDHLPLPLFCLQVTGKLDDFGLPSRLQAKAAIEDAVAASLPGERVLGYVVVDRGTFQKTVAFRDPVTDRIWSDGTASESVLFYGFLRGARAATEATGHRAASAAIRRLGVTADQVMRLQV